MRRFTSCIRADQALCPQPKVTNSYGASKDKSLLGHEISYLRCNAVLLHEWFLCQVDLKGVIRWQTNIQAPCKENWKWVSVIVQKKGIVGQWRHAQTDLSKIIHVLQAWGLPQVDAMWYIIAQHHCTDEVINVPSLSSMRPKRESVQTSQFPKLIQNIKICIYVVSIIGIWRVFMSPLLWWRIPLVGTPFWTGFIINHVESNNLWQITGPSEMVNMHNTVKALFCR